MGGGNDPPKQLGIMYVYKYLVLVGEFWYDAWFLIANVSVNFRSCRLSASQIEGFMEVA